MNLPCLLSGTLASLIGATSFAERPDEPFSLWPTDLTVRGTVIACPSGKPVVDITKIFLAASGGTEARTVVIHFDPHPPPESLLTSLAKTEHAEFLAAYGAGAVDPETLASALLEATGVVLFSEGALADPQVGSLLWVCIERQVPVWVEDQLRGVETILPQQKVNLIQPVLAVQPVVAGE